MLDEPITPAEPVTPPEEAEQPEKGAEPSAEGETPKQEVISKEQYDKTVAGFQRKLARLEKDSARMSEESAQKDEAENKIRELQTQLQSVQSSNTDYSEDMTAQELANVRAENESLKSEKEAEKRKNLYREYVSEFREEYPDAVELVMEEANTGNYFLSANSLSDLEEKVKRLQDKIRPKEQTEEKEKITPAVNPTYEAPPQVNMGEMSSGEIKKVFNLDQKR